MSESLERPVVTCSVGFNDPDHDELVYAKQVAEQRQCDHHEDIVQPNITELVPKLARLFDEPFADSSAVPTYYVSEMARRHVTVALSGDGGDELFAGYSRHGLQCLEARLRGALGGAGTRALAKVAAWLPEVKGRNTLRKLGMTPEASYALKHAGYVFPPDRKMAMYDAELRSQLRDCDPAATFRKLYDQCEATDPLTKALYVDLKTYLVDDILVKVDRMSMAHALEVRAPLLDQNFVEFVMRLPRSLKLDGRTTKVALKKLLNGRVPEKIVNRKKHGFTMPLGATLRGPLAGMVQDTLMSSRFRQRGYFDAGVVKAMCESHAAGAHDYGDQLWTLMMFELWHREYLDVRDVHAAA
jgi:asparagine synthase (glutamine-hydrolysing)